MRGSSAWSVLLVLQVGCSLTTSLDGLSSGKKAPASASGSDPSAGATPAPDSSGGGSASSTPWVALTPNASTLAVDSTSDVVSATVSGAFSLDFQRTKGWQIGDYYDLLSSASAPTSLADSSLGFFRALTFTSSANGCAWPNGCDPTSASTTSHTVLESSPVRLRLHTDYQHVLENAQTSTSADYTVDASGRVSVSITLRNTGTGPIDLYSIEYAEVALAPAQWSASTPSPTAYALARGDGLAPFPVVWCFDSNGDTNFDDNPLVTQNGSGILLPEVVLASGASISKHVELELLHSDSPALLTGLASDLLASTLGSVHGATMTTSSWYDADQGAFALTLASPASPHVDFVIHGLAWHAPVFVVDGWTSPNFIVKRDGIAIASNEHLVSSVAVASFDPAAKRLVVLDAQSDVDGSTFTVDVP